MAEEFLENRVGELKPDFNEASLAAMLPVFKDLGMQTGYDAAQIQYDLELISGERFPSY